MAKGRLIEPRLKTPTSPDSWRNGSNRQPASLLSEQLQRLAVCTAVAAGLWTYGLVMDTLVRPLTVVQGIPQTNVALEVFSIVLSGLMFLYIRFASHSAETKSNLGLVYFVLNAAAVAALNNWDHLPANNSSITLSWNTVVILVSSMIMPTTPRKMLATALIAASMDPLAVWIGYLRGLPTPSALNTFVFFMPNYACAVAATFSARMVHRLGRQLRQAQELGSYHLVELLGRGGMGEVWRGRHRFLARSAAIKLVRPELLGASKELDAQTMLRRFEREAQATAALSSPHTIRVFDFGVTADRTFYYVMELLDGRDLESLVREFGPLPADRAVFMLRQIAHSLAEAHASGLIHRDITPSNVYACRMGLEYDFIKVLDFGLVSFHDQPSIERTLMTGVHTTNGTPGFMAPEIILNGEVDPRADVYAFGCVAYYLLTGQQVFEADTAMKMFVEHLQTPPIPPSQRTELPIPREVDDLVMSCLEKDPDRRPQDGLELQRLLAACRSAETWDNDQAKAWWERHLVELTAPAPASSEHPTGEPVPARL